MTSPHDRPPSYSPDWTLDEAIAAQRQASPRVGSGPLFQWLAHHELLRLRERFDRGEQMALMRALAVCAKNDLAMPDWVSVAYLDAFRKTTHFNVKTWDDAFGAPHPKGTHIAADRNRRELAVAVWLEVSTRDADDVRKFDTVAEAAAFWLEVSRIKDANPKTPIDEYLFETVGKKFKIGKTLASEYYYLWKDSHSPGPGSTKS